MTTPQVTETLRHGAARRHPKTVHPLREPRACTVRSMHPAASA